jgi:hypothetical protein
LGIEVTADIQDALDALGNLKGALDSLPETVNPEVDLEDDDAQTKIDDFNSDLQDIDGEDVEPEIDIGGDGLDQIQTIQTTLDEVNGESVEPDLELGGDGQNEIQTIQTTLDSINGEEVEPDITLNDDAETQIDSIKTDLEDINGETVTPEVNVDGDAITNLPAIRDDIESLPATQEIELDLTGDVETQLPAIRDDVESLPATQSIEIEETGNADSQIETIKDDAESIPTTIDIDVETDAGDADSQLENTKNDADDLSNSEGDAGQAGEQAGSDISDGMGVAATGITAVSAEAENLTQQLYEDQTAMQQLAIFTGETNQQMTTLVNNVTSASVSQQYAEQYIQTLMQLGVPNDLLQKNAEELAKIGEATGNDAETTSAFAQTVVALGGDAQDMGDYLGMAGYEQQNFVGGLQNFSQMAPMFAVQMSAMGFSTQQSAVIMADMSQKTGGTRKGMMALMTAANGSGAALLNELNTTTPAVNTQADSFGNYTNKVNEASSADENNQSWVAQLQTEYTKLMLTLGDIGPEILTIAGAIGTLVAGPSAAAWLADKLFQTDFQTAYNDWLKTKLEPVTDLMKSALQKAGVDIGDSAEDAGKTVDNDVGKATEDMGNSFKSGFNYVNETIENAGDELNFSDIGERFDTDFVDVGNGIKSGISDIGSTIKSGLGNVGNTVTDGANSLKSDFDYIGSSIKTSIGDWKDGFSGADDGVIDMFKNLDGTWEAQSPNFLEKIVTFGKNITGDLTDGINLPDLSSLGGKIPDSLTEGIGSKVGDLIPGVGEILAVVTTGIQGVYGYTQNTKEGPIGVMLGLWGLSLPAPLEKIESLLSSDSILSGLLGPGQGEKITSQLNQTFNVPIMNALNPIPGEVEKDLSGIPSAITNAFKGSGGNPLAGLQTDFDNGLNGIKSDVTGFVSWISGEPMKMTSWKWSNVTGNIGDIIGGIEKDLGGLQSWVTSFKLPSSYQLGQDLVVGLTDAVWGIVDAVKDIEGGYNDLKSFLGKLPSEISADANNIWKSITGGLSEAEKDITGGIKTVEADFTNFESDIKKIPSEIEADAKNIWNGLVAGYNDVKADILGGINDVKKDFTDFESWITSIPSQIESDARNVWNGLVTGYNDVKADIFNIPNEIKKDITDFESWLTGIPGQIETDAENIWKGFVTGIKNEESAIETEISNLETDFWNDVKWIEDLPDEMLKYGEGVITGFIQGMENKVPGLNQALAALSALFPHSPPETGPLTDVNSDNMTNYADTLMNGFITGVTNNITGVLNALKTIASLFPHSPVESGPLADVTPANMTSLGIDLMGGLASGITSGSSQVTSALQTVQSTVNNNLNSSSGGSSSNSTLISDATTASSAVSQLATAAQTASGALIQTATTSTSVASSLNQLITNTATPILSAIEQANVAANAGATTQQVTVNFHPNSIQLPEGVTPDSARAIAGAFGDEVAKRINRGAISNGLKPYSIYNNPNLHK